MDSSNERSNDAGRLAPAAVYRRFLDALNRQDLTEAEAWVDPTRYRENCVGFTDGYVNWADAQTSVQTIWKGLPDLHVKLHDLATGPDFAIARGTVSGTALGRLYGAPATKHHYEASYFDDVRLDQGRIVERVQQADILGQMRRLYGRVLGVAGSAPCSSANTRPTTRPNPPSARSYRFHCRWRISMHGRNTRHSA